MGRPPAMLRMWAAVSSRRTRSFFYVETKGKPNNKIKYKKLYRHIIYENFQKKIFYDMNIFLESNKIHTNSDKTKSATGLLKSNKNHFKNTKMKSNLFLSNFLL